MVRPINVLASKYSKYFRPNAKIYNTLNPSPSTATNPLTGSVVQNTQFLDSRFIKKQEDYFDCILEFRIRKGEVSEKPGINSGEVLLQGRYYSHLDGLVDTVGDNFSPRPWYKPGGRYYIESDYLGTGIVYPLEQISSMYVAEAYFGYPLLMKFLRYTPDS